MVATVVQRPSGYYAWNCRQHGEWGQYGFGTRVDAQAGADYHNAQRHPEYQESE